MSDIRARVVEELDEQFEGMFEKWHDAIADVLLSLPGIAVVELPEPDGTMSDTVDVAEKALEGVTEGPWEAVNVGNIHWGVSSGGYDFPTVVKAQCSYDGFGSGSKRADAEFIAAARTLVPELVAELKAARAQLRKPAAG